MKNTLLKKNIFLTALIAFAIIVLPGVASAQYGTDWGYTDYGTDWGYTDYGTDWGYTDYGTSYNDNGGNYAYNDPYYYDYNDYDYGYSDYGYDNYGGYSYNDDYYGGDYGYGGDCGDCGYTPPQPCYDCYYDPCDHNDCTPPRPNYRDLDVECVANPRNAEEGERVTWRVYASGGNGDYDFNWSGDVDGNSGVEYETYNREGIYYGTVRVRSGDGQTETANCSVRVEEEEKDDLRVRCEYTPSNPDEDDRVTFRAIVSGGAGNYDYDWSGDARGDDRTITERFSREGRYEVEITVTDRNGNRDSDTCVLRVDGDDDDTNVNISSTPNLAPPTGTPASLSSVYLSQVPYTGPEDVLMVSLWGIVLALLSFVGVREYKKSAYKKMKKNRINAFKEENKANLSA